MEAISMRVLPFSPSLIGSEKPKIKRNYMLNCGRIYRENRLGKLGNSDRHSSLRWRQPSVLAASGDFSAVELHSGSFLTGFDIDQDLKTASDEYVEQSLVGKSITDIFEQHGESFFRYFEGEALRKLSSIPKQVVSTGGGAVINRANWKYMKQGVSVFLDVPIYTLALRIAKDHPGSRPILQDGSVGLLAPLVFRKLLILYKRRKAAYANADATVSVLRTAKKLDIDDVSDISTTAITLESLQ